MGEIKDGILKWERNEQRREDWWCWEVKSKSGGQLKAGKLTVQGGDECEWTQRWF